MPHVLPLDVDDSRMNLSKRMLRDMLLIRKFELRLKQLFAEGKIPGFIHLCVGQEATAVGVCSNLREDDYVLSTHRGHGHCIAKGANLRLMMAEVFGKRDGCCKGKGGSMHIAVLPIGILSSVGIVGSGLPLAVGAGLSAKLRRTNQVAACFFGDGAVDQGTFHESLNLASLWKLPVVFVCENNLYCESVHISKHLSAEGVAGFANTYRIPGATIDGNDVMAVYEASHAAIDRARAGMGPTLLECMTYRWGGHSESDPWKTYRSVDEVEQWKKKCPIKTFETRLIQEGVLTIEEANKIEAEVDEMIEEAVRFAEESAWPDPEEAMDDVFAVAGDVQIRK
jgi:TPP-dependent pyruvate/acetoin dehydrogenase alpha subunit